MGACERNFFLRMHSDDSLISYTSYGWPVRSVEQLTPYVPKKLANPVLLVGNTVRIFHSQANSIGSTTTISRVTLSRRTQMRGIPPRCLATMLTCSSKPALVTRVSLRPRLALWASCSATSQHPRLVSFQISADCAFTRAVSLFLASEWDQFPV